jgi:pimeloyl-ACP methyl ester carboxylesterase
MTTVLFVHGTGVRKGYDNDVITVREQLSSRLANVLVAPCHWAAPEHGLRAELGQNGASIPRGRFGRGEADDDNSDVILWGYLYADPYYELRILALLPPDSEASEDYGSFTWELQELQQRLLQFSASVELNILLDQAGIQHQLRSACEKIATDPILDQIVGQGVHSPEVVSSALARTIIADAIAQLSDTPVRIAMDSTLRDAVMARIDSELSGREIGRGATEWMKQAVMSLLTNTATWYLRRDASVATHFAFPFSGDILRYQRDGTAIRAFIRDRILASPPPVYLLAHSLGGVICFDLLCLEDLSSHVAGLITVGSQAPLLYEMDNLSGVRFEEPLPTQVPPWLNLYDQRDLLSFVGSSLFPQRVEDVEVDNRQPFPNAHTSYWTNSLLWDTISTWIKRD